MIFSILRSKTARRVIKLRKGISSVSFGGENSNGGIDLYVTAARKYANFSNGKFEGYFDSDSTLYKISGVEFGSIESFKRTIVRS